MRIGKIASGTEFRIDEQFQNFLIFGISIVFQIIKKLLKFVKLPIWEIQKKFQSVKFQKFL